LLVLALLVGTLIPGAWRKAVESGLGTPSFLPSLAHFVLFLGMALAARLRPLAFSVICIAVAALGLGLLSEGLQFFAVDRHPRWRDVGIDFAGALVGLACAEVVSRYSGRR